MSRRTRVSVTASIVTPSQPPAVALTLEQLAEACGIRVVHLVHLVRVGVVEPEPPESEVFSASAATRLRKMLRLRADLGVNLAGAAIIVDLLARLDRLEAELARARRSERARPRAKKEMP
jgi:chaperone modulatory protein CbpM